MVNQHLKDQDLKLPYAKFAYNRAPSATTRLSPFEVVYGVNPITFIEQTFLVIDLQLYKDTQDKMKTMKKFHEGIKVQIEKTNKAYKKKTNKHRKPFTFQPVT